MFKKVLIIALLLALQSTHAATITRVEFKDANIRDAARILATLSGANIAVTREASNASVDLLLQNIELKHAVEMISRVSGLWYRYSKSNNSYIIMTEKQYQEDIVIYRDDIIRSFTLKHQNVTATALTIQSLFGDRVILKLQEDLDDFSGIPSDYLQSIDEQTSSNSRTNSSRVNNTSNNGGSSNNSSGNSNYNGESSGEVTTLQNEEDTQTLVSTNSNLSTTQLRMLNTTKVNADVNGKRAGIKTPIFIATNRIHNLMFIRTSDEQAMSDIEDLINKSDKPTPQVLLETKILRISQGESFDQDFDLSYKSAVQTPKTDSNTSITLDEIRDAAVTGAGFNGATGGFYEYYSKYVNAKIELLEEKNIAEIIAKPILLASNNRPSRLFIGEDQVIAVGLDGGSTTSNSNGNTSVTTSTDTQLETEVRKIGNTLALLPSVNDDGTVTIDILQSTSELKKQGMDFPFFNPTTGQIDSVKLDTVEESTLKTIVVAKDGHTIALGGMINQVDTDKKSTIPVLGDIPFLGELFRTKNEIQSDAQYIMLITPHIIATPEEAAKKSRELEEIDFARYEDTASSVQAPASITATNEIKINDLMHLNRYAARRLHGKPTNSSKIQTLPIKQIKLPKTLLRQNMHSWPVAAYKSNGTYLTVVRVQNLSQQPFTLDPKAIDGRWLSIARERSTLGPFQNKENNKPDSSYLYFASKQPFNQSHKK
ncbi:DUF3438 family protein [Neptunomonas japonica]|uniref:DUF3438 family protein n=1 Tax=Neptunomonas japonica TaxID=417574 RepID=UPI00040AC9EE|nr:DUF3438 family protein [Neptunomonas japonica]